MKTIKTKRYKNTLISYRRSYRFRDNLLFLGKKPNMLFLNSTFNNPYRTYEIISRPVSNGTYKVKVVALDDLLNQSSSVEGTVAVTFYPLPPVSVSASASGSDITLTWSHSVDGAPDYYVIYSNNGNGSIDRNTPIATIVGSLLTYTLTVADGDWEFVVESKKNGVESKSLRLVEITIPTTNTEPHKPGPSGDSPLAVTGIVLENVSVGKVRIKFYWVYGSEAATFNVYHDGGTGTINYVSPNFSFARGSNFIQEYLTTQLHVTDDRITYKFVVRAVSPDGIEEKNEDEYSIVVDGQAPDAISDLSLSTIF